METPPSWDPLTKDNLSSHVGLVKDFFLAKFAASANANEPLVEDDELPVKQRFPKPRLPPTGKITSPRKRPIREQQQMAKKKRKLEELGKGGGAGGANGAEDGEKEQQQGAIKKLKLEMPSQNQDALVGDPEKEMGDKEEEGSLGVGMMSPESM